MSSTLFLAVFALIYLAIFLRPFKLQEGTIAVIGAGLILLLGIVTPTEAAGSILGTFSHPWQIIVFFISFAIISTTLEDLGFFRWWALHITNLAKHDGKRLFNYLFLGTAIITFFTANDIVILTLTPLVLELGFHHKKHPRAYLYLLFFVANTGSIGHLLGNITNIIVSDTFQISFLESVKYLFLPMIAALAVEYIILRWYFRTEINQKFTVNKKIKPHQALIDKTKVGLVLAILGIVLFLALLQPWHGVDLWIITTFGALATIIIGRFNPIQRIVRVPWQVILFMTSLFVIITGFTKNGISAYFSDLLPALQNKSLAVVTILGTYLTSIVAAIMNNIPGTITMSNILASSSLSGINQKALIYATIIGSNLGANLTIIGALAGLMWMHLIREKKYSISALEFTKIGLLVMIPTILVIALILWLELIVF